MRNSDGAEFLAILQRWKGRRWVEERYEDKGFGLPGFYQSKVRAWCQKQDCRDDIDVFWDEMAMEYLATGGERRRMDGSFNRTPAYRSAYLDQIAAVDASPYFQVAHPCLARLHSHELETNWSFIKSVMLEIKKLRLSEVHRFDLTADHDLFRTFYDNPTATNFSPVFEHYASTFGYQRAITKGIGGVLRHGWRIERTSGLCLSIGINRSAGSYVYGSLPIVFVLHDRRLKKPFVDLGNFEIVAPGTSNYALTHGPGDDLVGTPETTRFAIEAQLSFAAVFLDSFED